MLHKISQFCDKINTINKMAEDLRVLKYQTPKSKDRDFRIQNLIDTIQADCHLVANDKSDYGKENDKDGDQKKKKDQKNNEKKKQKPQQGKMSPEQIKQLLESLKNEEKKTQKKLNAKKAKGSKIKQEKDW